MIELRNVTKVYKPSKGVTVKALSNINLSFKEKGFVVLTGESGSGKTTLLNILAGLDNYTQGDMLIDGISTKKIKETAWDEYRNKRVGIVFQNYSLLEEFSVKKNVSLALELQRIDDKKEWVDWALDRANMYDYMNKRVNKLSGGQKQRVAIARAIVKNPQIILADEPTGNLDTINSEEIFKLLKELSKEHLVVVITHNEELAKKYADRLIRLVDGEIVEDKKVSEEVLEEPSKEKSLPPKGLKVGSILSLGLSSMAKQWFRLLATIMMLIVMLTSIGIALGVSRYSKNEVLAKVVLEGDNTLLAIKKNDIDNPYFTSKDNKFFEENGYKYIEVLDNDENLVFHKYQTDYLQYYYKMLAMKPYFSMQPSGFIAIEDLKDCGINYNLVNGRWPENNFEVCITKYTANVLLADSAAVCSNPENRPLTQEELQRLPIQINKYHNVTVVGIVETNLDEEYYSGAKEKYNELIEELKGVHNVIFATKTFVNEIINYNPIIRISYPDYMLVSDMYFYKCVSKSQIYTINKASRFGNYEFNYIYGDNKLDVGEVFVTKNMFIRLLNEKLGRVEYTIDTVNIDEIIHNEIRAGFKFDSKIMSFINQTENELETTEFCVVGLTDCPKPVISDDYEELVDTTIITHSSTYLVDIRSLDVDQLMKLADNYTITTSKIYDVNSVSNRANQIKVLGILLGILFGLLSIITIIDFTQASIKGSYRHIGIIRAIGARKIDIYKIYIVQTIILAVISIVVASLLLSPIVQYLDQSSTAQEVLGLSLFTTKPVYFAIIGILGALITFGSAIVMMYISLKKKIIDLFY